MGGVIQSKSRAVYWAILLVLLCFVLVALFAHGAHAIEATKVLLILSD